MTYREKLEDLFKESYPQLETEWKQFLSRKDDAAIAANPMSVYMEFRNSRESRSYSSNAFNTVKTRCGF